MRRLEDGTINIPEKAIGEDVQINGEKLQYFGSYLGTHTLESEEDIQYPIDVFRTEQGETIVHNNLNQVMKSRNGYRLNGNNITKFARYMSRYIGISERFDIATGELEEMHKFNDDASRIRGDILHQQLRALKAITVETAECKQETAELESQLPTQKQKDDKAPEEH